MLPAVKSLWIGKRCSVVEQLALKSFLENGHNFYLYVYDDIYDIPDGIRILDANSIIKEEKIFISHNSYAHFADWFRWKMLNTVGGYWVDMDMVCLKPFDFGDDIIYGKEQYDSASIGVLRFPAGHELASRMIQRCEHPNSINRDDRLKIKLRKARRILTMRNHLRHTKWGEAGGPWGFKQVLLELDLWSVGKPYTYFYPVHSSHWRYIFDDTLSSDGGLFRDTHAIHLWNDMIRKDKSFNINDTFPKCSLFEQLKSRYLR